MHVVHYMDVFISGTSLPATSTVRVITGRNASSGSATALRGMINYGLTLESSMTRDSSRPS